MLRGPAACSRVGNRVFCRSWENCRGFLLGRNPRLQRVEPYSNKIIQKFFNVSGHPLQTKTSKERVRSLWHRRAHGRVITLHIILQEPPCERLSEAGTHPVNRERHHTKHQAQ